MRQVSRNPEIKSLRRGILSELRKHHNTDPVAGHFHDIRSLLIWKDATGRRRGVEFGKALSQLTAEGLVLSVRNENTPLSIRVNPERLPEINAEVSLDRKWVLALPVAIVLALAAYLTKMY
jgi:hypothetical protein